ncbi:MAG: divalent-cation tolerance protein CutA [Planctomycetota bacterium]
MAQGSSEIVVVLCTAPAEAAEGLARDVVAQRLCACVNVLPAVRSYFRWEGRVDEAEEVLLVAKTTAAAFAALRDRLVALHPYDVPEVLALDVRDGLPSYLSWLTDAVSS